MERLALWSMALFGPCYGLMILGLLIARRVFSETQILFELNEWGTLFVAAIVAVAVAGVVVQLI